MFINKVHGASSLFLQQSYHKYLVNKQLQILKYPIKRQSDSVPCRVIVVVSSIFHSPEILHLGQQQSYIEYLQELGQVYLVYWFEITDNKFSLNDYVLALNVILKIINQDTCKRIDLIGHCIGGNLAIAAATMSLSVIKTITLLTTPWDFSHFTLSYYILQLYGFERHIQCYNFIPKIYMQILFFLLSPDSFNKKLKQYFDLNSDTDKELFLKVEHWLMSCYALSKATYNQIMHDMLKLNLHAQNRWTIDCHTVNPDLITAPVCLVTAINDKIAPKQSIVKLSHTLKNSTIITTDGGHISYLLKEKTTHLFKSYKQWFQAQ